MLTTDENASQETEVLPIPIPEGWERAQKGVEIQKGWKFLQPSYNEWQLSNGVPYAVPDKFVYIRPKHVPPPLGVTPKAMFIESRIDDIIDAIQRYRSAGCDIPVEWAEELAERIKELTW